MGSTTFYDQIASNKRKSWLLVGFFVIFIGILLLVLNYIFDFGIIFVPIIAVLVALTTYATYANADKIVLAQSHAKPADEFLDKSVYLYLKNTVEGLALAAGIPAPRLYIINDSSPNAFATGKDPEHAIICVTTGLVQKMNRQELEGVIAHEMSHILNFDTRLMMLASVMAGFAVLIADVIFRSMLWGGHGRSDKGGGGVFIALLAIGVVFAVLTPVIAQVLQLAISRKREYLADASAVQLTRYPPGLMSALSKLAADKEPLEAANKATAHLYISDPLKNQKMMLKGLFSTHPPIEERINALKQMTPKGV